MQRLILTSYQGTVLIGLTAIVLHLAVVAIATYYGLKTGLSLPDTVQELLPAMRQDIYLPCLLFVVTSLILLRRARDNGLLKIALLALTALLGVLNAIFIGRSILSFNYLLYGAFLAYYLTGKGSKETPNQAL